ncbi:MAG: N-acetylmuramoyl-L-alanine amidase family protein, partial [Lachnospiraceae bacterium]|nr:N-acetylmuramoyl-L-alanine amidase family protein [Lachnospiraceae bacterium]
MTKRSLVNKAKKSSKVFVASALMAAMMAQPVMAASTISSVSVKLNIDLQEGDDLPTLECGYDNSVNRDTLEVIIDENKRYDFVKAEWSKDDVEEAELGKTYKLKVTLESKDEDEYEFKSSYTSSKVNVKGGSFVSARRNDADQLVITLKTDAVTGILEEPDDPRWL